MAAGNTLAATLCYICAGNIDKTVEVWSRTLASEHEGKSYVDILQVSLHLLFVCMFFFYLLPIFWGSLRDLTKSYWLIRI